jgi:hypothetical protein
MTAPSFLKREADMRFEYDRSVGRVLFNPPLDTRRLMKGNPPYEIAST